jgi:hypothetical protein
MSKRNLLTISLMALGAAACSIRAGTEPRGADPTVVLSVSPVSGSTNVDPSGPITITFNHSMAVGMEMLVILHETSVTGPQIAGVAVWSTDRTRLTFTPAQALKAKTTYVLHLSPNLTDANGRRIDFASCAQQVNGQAVGMMNGGMMSGGSGPGMMGPGWQAGSGPWGYGMTFTFATL